MLNTCALEEGRWRYREIYIHSKLMMANDVFFTLGSANANQRSLAVDSEINVAVQDAEKVMKLRRDVWSLLSGKVVDGGDGSREALKHTFEKWNEVMYKNLIRRNRNSQDANLKKLQGFIMSFEDNRSSLIRFG